MQDKTNGAYCTIVAANADQSQAHLRVYTHSREGRFQSVGMLRVSRQHLEALIAQIDRRAFEHDNPMLPPWQPDDPNDNVRFLPPQ
jgi:hypothetical protein